MALAASAWVTTEQELKLPVAAAVVTLAESGAGALVASTASADLEADEPHAASTMAVQATVSAVMPGRIVLLTDMGRSPLQSMCRAPAAPGCRQESAAVHPPAPFREKHQDPGPAPRPRRTRRPAHVRLAKPVRRKRTERPASR